MMYLHSDMKSNCTNNYAAPKGSRITTINQTTSQTSIQSKNGSICVDHVDEVSLEYSSNNTWDLECSNNHSIETEVSLDSESEIFERPFIDKNSFVSNHRSTKDRDLSSSKNLGPMQVDMYGNLQGAHGLSAKVEEPCRSLNTSESNRRTKTSRNERHANKAKAKNQKSHHKSRKHSYQSSNAHKARFASMQNEGSLALQQLQEQLKLIDIQIYNVKSQIYRLALGLIKTALNIAEIEKTIQKLSDLSMQLLIEAIEFISTIDTI